MLTRNAIEWRVMNDQIINNMEYVTMTIKPVSKLLKISGENTKIAKTIAKAGGAVFDPLAAALQIIADAAQQVFADA